MPLIDLTLQHGQTFEEARRRLEAAVKEANAQFGSMIQRVEWAADRSRVKREGVGGAAPRHQDRQPHGRAYDPSRWLLVAYHGAVRAEGRMTIVDGKVEIWGKATGAAASPTSSTATLYEHNGKRILSGTGRAPDGLNNFEYEAIR